MIKIKKIILFTIKSVLALVALLTLILFFYAAFFYETPTVEKKIIENQVTKSDESSDIEEEKRLKKEEEQRLKEAQVQKKIQVETVIEDGLYATVGNKAITKSDIVNEIKVILILNDKIYSKEESGKLQKMAIQNVIKRNIKLIEIERNNFLQFNQQDLNKELLRLANNINIDLNTLKNRCESNGLDFSIIIDQIKAELLWNSLIFQLYKDRLSINLDEIDEQLKLIKNKKEIEEYLLSEIVMNAVEKSKLKSVISEVKNKIKIEGFESVAVNSSISNSASRGGDLGWVSESVIPKELKSVISKTSVGNISEPVLLPDGILIFKIRNKRKVEKNVDIEEIKNELVNAEKTKILNMHSSAYYNNLRRSVSVKFFQ